MLEATTIPISCPECDCPVATTLTRVMLGAGVFCPACQVHITLVDDRGGVSAMNRTLEHVFEPFSQTIEIRFEL